jgi:hypothetical protein
LDAQACTVCRRLKPCDWIALKKRILLVLVFSLMVFISGCKEDRQNKLLSTTRPYDTTTEESDLFSKVGGIPDSAVSDGIKPMNYIDNGDGVITDNVTKLIWQKVAPSTNYNWGDALTYCKNLKLAGFSDWQLPDVQSLITILDLDKNCPTINAAYFLNNISSGYWTSSTNVSHTGNAWSVSFCNAIGVSQVNGDLNKTSFGYVRCVRF